MKRTIISYNGIQFDISLADKKVFFSTDDTRLKSPFPQCAGSLVGVVENNGHACAPVLRIIFDYTTLGHRVASK